MNFDELSISDDIKRAIDEMGFEKLTPIQESAIPEALNGNDLIGQAQTGSGKTLAFAVPVLDKIFILQFIGFISQLMSKQQWGNSNSDCAVQGCSSCLKSRQK